MDGMSNSCNLDWLLTILSQLFRYTLFYGNKWSIYLKYPLIVTNNPFPSDLTDLTFATFS